LEGHIIYPVEGMLQYSTCNLWRQSTFPAPCGQIMPDPLNSVFHASMDFNFYPVLPIAALAFMYLQSRSVSIPWDNQLKLLFTPTYKDIISRPWTTSRQP